MRGWLAAFFCVACGNDSPSSTGSASFVSGRTVGPATAFEDEDFALEPPVPQQIVSPSVEPLAPNGCHSAAEDYARNFGACPGQRPSVAACEVEGLECLYPLASEDDAGSDSGCFALVTCSVGWWSPRAQRCPGPLYLNLASRVNPVPVAVPLPPTSSASTSNTSPVAAGSRDAAAPVGSVSELDADVGDAGAFAVGEGAELGTDPALSLDSALEAGAEVGAGSTLATSTGDAGALGRVVVDASTADASALGPVAVDASAGAVRAFDASSDAVVVAEPGASTSAADPPKTAPMDCPELSPVPGAPCSVAGLQCGYGECVDRTSARVALCTCGHWLEQHTVCGMAEGL